MAPTAGRLSMSSEVDPFSTLLAPVDETPQERALRQQSEVEAKRISDEIDTSIQLERQQQSTKRIVRILLLGQSESGKSTLQRQFTLMHAPETFNSERSGWRLVIFLNVVRSVQRILSTLNTIVQENEESDEELESRDPTPYSPQLASTPSKSPSSFVAQMTLQLSPVTKLEDNIISKLLDPEEHERARSGKAPSSSTTAHFSSGTGLTGILEGKDREFFVRPGSGWRRGKGGFVGKFKRGIDMVTGNESSTAEVAEIDWDDKDDPGRILHMCGENIIALWADPWVKSQLRRKRVRLEEGAGFFLDDLERIAQPRYTPTDGDILRARIKTIGVSEHIFPRSVQGVEWRIYDVGGARTQRQAWAPFFDLNSIIFLAPLSPFDTALPEDRRVNALEDSLLIWRELCTNKILANVPLVLFLNKSDLLRKKLEDGVQVSRYVVSYGDRPNTYESVEKYFRAKFEAIRKQHTRPTRPVFVHVTTCIDQKTTTSIISHVQDILMRENLKNSSLL